MDWVKKINQEYLNGLWIILLGLWIWGYSKGFPALPEGYPGPELFPRLIGATLILAGILLIVFNKGAGEITQGPSSSRPSGRGVLRLLGGMAIVAIYPLTQPYFGFIPSLSFVCFLMATLLGVRLFAAAITGVVTALVIYAVFVEILGVPL